MAFTINYAVNPQLVGAASYASGLGQYNKWKAEYDERKRQFDEEMAMRKNAQNDAERERSNAAFIAESKFGREPKAPRRFQSALIEHGDRQVAQRFESQLEAPAVEMARQLIKQGVSPQIAYEQAKNQVKQDAELQKLEYQQQSKESLANDKAQADLEKAKYVEGQKTGRADSADYWKTTRWSGTEEGKQSRFDSAQQNMREMQDKALDSAEQLSMGKDFRYDYSPRQSAEMNRIKVDVENIVKNDSYNQDMKDRLIESAMSKYKMISSNPEFRVSKREDELAKQNAQKFTREEEKRRTAEEKLSTEERRRMYQDRSKVIALAQKLAEKGPKDIDGNPTMPFEQAKREAARQYGYDNDSDYTRLFDIQSAQPRMVEPSSEPYGPPAPEEMQQPTAPNDVLEKQATNLVTIYREAIASGDIGTANAIKEKLKQLKLQMAQ